ncbi:hypothetical protein RB628_00635 [Streptomyces sp. ADMS]|uniref:hypothetical protein n=1 Tax=Streptomyces sp. ADMS TaxID=3071415 RepID=UPI00296EC32D|nr:hypothetical protein [Streptomyces sp. ADMS]MDW4903888.1 hypothetical protein [Streptomyces sp. ADMS]
MSTEPPASGEQSSISDEELERLAREAESSGDGGSAPKEPSARQRMVTERLRRQDEEAARAQGRSGKLLRRKGKKAASDEPWQPEGWRTGPAWQEMNGRKRRGRQVRAALGVLLAVGAAVVAVKPSLVTSRLPEGVGGPAAADTEPLPAETAAPTAAPVQETFPDAPTLKEPFRGSPAVRYADGAEGIVLPEAKPVGRMTRQQVATALEAARDFLVDANLDPATLRGRRPETALAQLDTAYDEFAAKAETWLKKPGEKSQPEWLFSRFDPDELRPVGDVVKTRGRMTFTQGAHGSVKIRADYTFVYPLVKAADGSTEVARTIVRRIMEFESYDPARAQATEGKLWITLYNVDRANDDCDVHDGYLHPQFDSDLSTAPPPTGPAGSSADPYDRSRDLTTEDSPDCGTVTRT